MSISEDYLKYIKYKTKYIKLKQRAGATDDSIPFSWGELDMLIDPPNTKTEIIFDKNLSYQEPKFNKYNHRSIYINHIDSGYYIKIDNDWGLQFINLFNKIMSSAGPMKVVLSTDWELYDMEFIIKFRKDEKDSLITFLKDFLKMESSDPKFQNTMMREESLNAKTIAEDGIQERYEAAFNDIEELFETYNS